MTTKEFPALEQHKRNVELSARVAVITVSAWQANERDWAYEGEWVYDDTENDCISSLPLYACDLVLAWDLIAWVIANRPDRVQEFDAVIAGHQPERLASHSLARLVCLEFLRHFEDDASQRDWYDLEICGLLNKERR